MSKVSSTNEDNHTKTNGIAGCFDRALGYLGKENSAILCYHLEKHGVKKEEILEKPTLFVAALRSMFGDASIFLEKRIISEIAKENNTVSNESNLEEILKSLGKKSVSSNE